MQTAAIVALLVFLVAKHLDDRRNTERRFRVHNGQMNRVIGQAQRQHFDEHPNCRGALVGTFGIEPAGVTKVSNHVHLESGGALAAMAARHGLARDQADVDLDAATLTPDPDQAPLCQDPDCVLERHYGQHVFRVDDQAQDGPVGEHADDTVIVAVKLSDDPDQAKDTFGQLVDQAVERHVGAQGHVPAELYADAIDDVTVTTAIIKPPLPTEDELETNPVQDACDELAGALEAARDDADDARDDQADDEQRITSVTTEDVRTGYWKPVTNQPVRITCSHCDDWTAETRTPVLVVDEHLKDCPGLAGSRIASDVAELADTHPATNAILSTTTPDLAAEAALHLADRAAPLPPAPTSTFATMPSKTAQRADDPLASVREVLQPGGLSTPAPRLERGATPSIPIGWVDLNEAHEITGLSLPTLRKWANSDRLEARRHPSLGRMGWKHIVSRADCERIRDERA